MSNWQSTLEILMRVFVYACIVVAGFLCGCLIVRAFVVHPKPAQHKCVYFLQPGEKLNIQVDDQGHCMTVLPR